VKFEHLRPLRHIPYTFHRQAIISFSKGGVKLPYLAVAIGGLFGAIARFTISEWVVFKGGALATLLINVVGSFVLAWFYTFTLERVRIHPAIRVGIGTGFIGAFTTFSTLTKDSWALVQGGQVSWAMAYIILSFAGGLCAAMAGYMLAIRQSQLRITDEKGKEM
jgi:CrcB protein